MWTVIVAMTTARQAFYLHLVTHNVMHTHTYVHIFIGRCECTYPELRLLHQMSQLTSDNKHVLLVIMMESHLYINYIKSWTNI